MTGVLPYHCSTKAKTLTGAMYRAPCTQPAAILVYDRIPLPLDVVTLTTPKKTCCSGAEYAYS